MIVKKGLKFNERNRWTATIHTGLNPTANDVAKKLPNQIKEGDISVKRISLTGFVLFNADRSKANSICSGLSSIISIVISIK